MITSTSPQAQVHITTGPHHHRSTPLTDKSTPCSAAIVFAKGLADTLPAWSAVDVETVGEGLGGGGGGGADACAWGGVGAGGASGDDALSSGGWKSLKAATSCSSKVITHTSYSGTGRSSQAGHTPLHAQVTQLTFPRGISLVPAGSSILAR